MRILPAVLACALVFEVFAQAPLTEPSRGEWNPSTPAPRAPKNATRALQDIAEALNHAWQERHLDDATAMMDFPLWVVTDDGKSEAQAEAWTREKWLRVMGNMANQLPPKAQVKTTAQRIRWLTDRIAILEQERLLLRGPQKIRWRTSYVCVAKKDGWRITAHIEGGWGSARNQ